MSENATTPTLSPRPSWGVAATISASALFAFNGTVSKMMMQAGLPAPRLTQLRAVGAFVLCLAIIVMSGRSSTLRMRRSDLPILVAYGLVGFAVLPWLYFLTISRLPVGIGLLLEYTAPILVALWFRFGRHQPVRGRLWWGLVASIGGLALVAEVWGEVRLNGLGVLAGVASAVCLALYYLLGSAAGRGRDPLAVTCWGWGIAATASTLVQPTAFPIHVLGDTSKGIPLWVLALYFIGLGSIASYLLILTGLRHLPATSVSILAMAEPILAGTFAWLILGEVLSPIQLVGGAVVIAGVILAETARIAPTPTLDPASVTPEKVAAT